MGILSTEFAMFLEFVMPKILPKKKRKRHIILREFRKWSENTKKEMLGD